MVTELIRDWVDQYNETDLMLLKQIEAAFGMVPKNRLVAILKSDAEEAPQ